MGINISLAMLGVIFGWAMVKTKNKILLLIFFVLWVAFIPNTIYLVTDVNVLFYQLVNIDFIGGIFLTLEYSFLAILGIILFIIGHYSFEKLLLRTRFRKNKESIKIILFIANFLIAFGVVLGKVQRAESWDVFLNTQKVVVDTIHIMKSLPLLTFTAAFGLFINLVYFFLTPMFKRNILKKIY